MQKYDDFVIFFCCTITFIDFSDKNLSNSGNKTVFNSFEKMFHVKHLLGLF